MLTLSQAQALAGEEELQKPGQGVGLERKKKPPILIKGMLLGYVPMTSKVNEDTLQFET